MDIKVFYDQRKVKRIRSERFNMVKTIVVTFVPMLLISILILSLVHFQIINEANSSHTNIVISLVLVSTLFSMFFAFIVPFLKARRFEAGNNMVFVFMNGDLYTKYVPDIYELHRMMRRRMEYCIDPAYLQGTKTEKVSLTSIPQGYELVYITGNPFIPNKSCITPSYTNYAELAALLNALPTSQSAPRFSENSVQEIKIICRHQECIDIEYNGNIARFGGFICHGGFVAIASSIAWLQLQDSHEMNEKRLELMCAALEHGVSFD